MSELPIQVRERMHSSGRRQTGCQGKSVWGGSDFGADARLPYRARRRMVIGTGPSGVGATFHDNVSPFISYGPTVEDAQGPLRRVVSHLEGE
jgi:hypothetical protein